MQDNSFNSKDSDIFWLEQPSTELGPQRKNTLATLNSTELSREPAIEHITLSSVVSSEPQLITIYSDSNKPIILYGYGRQDAVVPTSLNDLNLPASPFNILATMKVVLPTAVTYDDNYSPQSPEPSEPSSISTPPMNLSTIEGRGNTAYDNWRQHLLFRRGAKDVLFPTIKTVLSTANPANWKKMRSGISFPKVSGVWERDSPYKKEHYRTFYRLK